MILRVEAFGLLCLVGALVGPVPLWLARASWPARNPRAGLVVWQAVGLGEGLGVLGAGFTLAASSHGGSWVSGIVALVGSWPDLGVLGWAGVVLTIIVGSWLMAVAVASTVRVVVGRRSHRHRLDMVANVLGPAHGAGNVRTPWHRPEALGARAPSAGQRRVDLTEVRLVDHHHTVAYCLPGLRPRVVVSRGALRALDDEELGAVLAHEWAHARGHHDLVIQPFVVWRKSFPFLPTARHAVAAVELLVEMLADDAAQRTCRAENLESALSRIAAARFSLSREPDPFMVAQLAGRRHRLVSPPAPLPKAGRLLAYLAATILVLAPPLILLLS